MVKWRFELQMQLTVTTPPVKNISAKPAGLAEMQIKITIPLSMRKANAARIPNRLSSLLHFWGKRCRIQSQSNTGELVQRAERKYSKLRPFYLMRIMPP